MTTSMAHRKFIAVIKMVPKGRVATYGQIAKVAGFSGHARQVVWTLHSSTKKYKLPWHRIINSQGKIGLIRDLDYLRQKNFLEREGIEFDRYGKVDLKVFQWKPKLGLVRKALKKISKI
jgi:methylated-DNA-protein-cysteine methyltransferase-like protein